MEKLRITLQFVEEGKWKKENEYCEWRERSVMKQCEEKRKWIEEYFKLNMWRREKWKVGK